MSSLFSAASGGGARTVERSGSMAAWRPCAPVRARARTRTSVCGLIRVRATSESGPLVKRRESGRAEREGEW
eukprot:scaffold120369_cov35-Tisochrysis_lutea.AAC.5